MSYIANNARMGVILKHPALTQGAKTKTGETQVRKWRIRRVMVRSGNTFSYPGSNIVPESFDIYQSLCVAAAVLLNSIANLSEVKKYNAWLRHGHFPRSFDLPPITVNQVWRNEWRNHGNRDLVASAVNNSIFISSDAGPNSHSHQSHHLFTTGGDCNELMGHWHAFGTLVAYFWDSNM